MVRHRMSSNGTLWILGSALALVIGGGALFGFTGSEFFHKKSLQDTHQALLNEKSPIEVKNRYRIDPYTPIRSVPPELEGRNHVALGRPDGTVSPVEVRFGPVDGIHDGNELVVYMDFYTSDVVSFLKINEEVLRKFVESRHGEVVFRPVPSAAPYHVHATVGLAEYIATKPSGDDAWRVLYELVDVGLQQHSADQPTAKTVSTILAAHNLKIDEKEIKASRFAQWIVDTAEHDPRLRINSGKKPISDIPSVILNEAVAEEDTSVRLHDPESFANWIGRNRKAKTDKPVNRHGD